MIEPFINLIKSIFKKEIQQNRYKQLLIYIGEGIHNYQDETFFKDKNIGKEIYEKNLREFFSYIRWIQLDQDICSDKKYEDILQFIKTDFYNYFSGRCNEIDLLKFKNLCESK